MIRDMDRPSHSISFFNQRSHFLGVEARVRRITCDKQDTLRLLLYLMDYKHLYLETDVAKIDSKTVVVVVLLLFLFHRLFSRKTNFEGVLQTLRPPF